MNISITLKSLLILSLLISLTACGLNSAGIKNTSIINYLSDKSMVAYERGEGILLFSFSKNTRDTEAYADWAEYLNDFKLNTPSGLTILEITSKEKSALNRNLQDFSVFLKKGYPSYLYDGLIVEPQVYTAVYKIYTDQELSQMDESFLPDPLCKFRTEKETC
jgi:hypothetical protein